MEPYDQFVDRFQNIKGKESCYNQSLQEKMFSQNP